MPTLSITKTYQDGDILLEADLDNIRNDITDFFNTTKIDSDNIQAGGVGASNIGINDSEYLEFGTGNDGRIGVVSDDLIIENVTSDKDIIFKVNDGGVTTTILTLNSDVPEILLGAAINANSKLISSVATPVSSGDATNKAYVDARMPTGSIISYGGTSAPSGWLLCDGSAVSRTTYADLFALIAETAGQGDNSTTFNVPDFRGRFLRGVDNGEGNDPDAASRTAMATGGNTGDNIFTLQDDDVGSHDHTVEATAGGTDGNGTAALIGVATQTGLNKIVETTGTGIGNETRPINAAVWYIIKT